MPFAAVQVAVWWLFCLQVIADAMFIAAHILVQFYHLSSLSLTLLCGGPYWLRNPSHCPRETETYAKEFIYKTYKTLLQNADIGPSCASVPSQYWLARRLNVDVSYFYI